MEHIQHNQFSPSVSDSDLSVTMETMEKRKDEKDMAHKHDCSISPHSVDSYFYKHYFSMFQFLKAFQSEDFKNSRWTRDM